MEPTSSPCGASSLVVPRSRDGDSPYIKWIYTRLYQYCVLCICRHIIYTYTYIYIYMQVVYIIYMKLYIYIHTWIYYDITYIVCVYSVCICLDTYYTRLKILLLRLAMMFQPLSLLLSWNPGTPGIHICPQEQLLSLSKSQIAHWVYGNIDISTTLGWKKRSLHTVEVNWVMALLYKPVIFHFAGLEPKRSWPYSS